MQDNHLAQSLQNVQKTENFEKNLTFKIVLLHLIFEEDFFVKSKIKNCNCTSDLLSRENWRQKQTKCNLLFFNVAAVLEMLLPHPSPPPLISEGYCFQSCVSIENQ